MGASEAILDCNSGRIGVTIETARQCLRTVNPGLTATKERLYE